MDLHIYKSNKNKNISGTVKVSGAKNSAVAIIPACLLTDEQVILENIPDITDVRNLIKIITDMGHFISFENNTLCFKRNNKAKYHFKDSINKLRGSYYLIGSYLGYRKKVFFYQCGGCNIGFRPINFHQNGFKLLNVKIKETKKGTLYQTKKLIGNLISLEFPSVGATINLMLAAVLAKGNTVIENAAKEPEVTDVANFLIKMGAYITGVGTDKLVISGTNKLHGTRYKIISDRIEAGTYLALGCINDNQPVTVTNIDSTLLTSFIDTLKAIGHIITINEDSITALKGKTLSPVAIKTAVYPGFSTDLGPIITPLLTQIEGTSTLTETIFERRFNHIGDLNKMGADITIKENTIIINGNTPLTGSKVTCQDLRGGASLLIAAIIAKNHTIIRNADIIKRGYEKPIAKLKNLNIVASIN